MPNDTAITRLLYAILSQKCLKDIDWNKVAHDPILCQEITNGHAARMRYSRFKKQMDGTATKARTRGPNNHNHNPNSPRKNNNSKISKSPRKGKGKAKEEVEEDEDSQTSVLGIKPEPGLSLTSRQGTAESEALSISERIPGRNEKRVKLEPGLRGENPQQQQPTPKTMPGTPSSGRYMREASASTSASPSPGPHSHSHEHGNEEGFAEVDELGFSFGMGGEDALPGMPMYAPPPFSGEYGMGSGSGFGMGMGMQIGMGDVYEGLWQGQGNGQGGHGGSGMQEGGGGVQVKTEPRWEEAYRRV